MKDHLKIVPMTLEQANELVKRWHRHHQPTVGHRWSIGVALGNRLVGAAICGRPKARAVPQYSVLEINRVVTDGTRNACSKLYGACAAIAKIMGFDMVQTAILESESGVTLKAAGFQFSHIIKGRDWNCPSRGGRRTDQPQCDKQVWFKIFADSRALPPEGEKKEDGNG